MSACDIKVVYFKIIVSLLVIWNTTTREYFLQSWHRGVAYSINVQLVTTPHMVVVYLHVKSINLKECLMKDISYFSPSPEGLTQTSVQKSRSPYKCFLPQYPFGEIPQTFNLLSLLVFLMQFGDENVMKVQAQKLVVPNKEYFVQKIFFVIIPSADCGRLSYTS